MEKLLLLRGAAKFICLGSLHSDFLQPGIFRVFTNLEDKTRKFEFCKTGDKTAVAKSEMQFYQDFSGFCEKVENGLLIVS